MTITIADVDAIVEDVYDRGIHYIGLGPEAPLWSRIPKRADFKEQTLYTRNRYGRNPGFARSFTVARSRAGASPFGRFGVTRANDFGSLQFENEALLALGEDAERDVSIVKEEGDSVLERSVQRMNDAMYKNQGGWLARITSGGNTQTITVTDRTHLINIYPGMYLVSSNTDGTSGAVDANPTLVTQVNREAGTITTSAAVSWDTAAGGFSNADYLFAQGDFGNSFYGLPSWVPSSAPSDTFLGQNRALDPVYLGGVRYTAQNGDPDGTILRTLNNAASEGRIHGAMPHDIFMNTLDYGAFLNELGDRVVYDYDVKARVDYKNGADVEISVGITGVKVALPTGIATVIPDNHCPRNVFWMLDMRTIMFHGLKTPGFMWVQTDGNAKFMRKNADNQNAIEATYWVCGNLVVHSPGCNIYVDATLVL
jgi:hypothetical protein